MELLLISDEIYSTDEGMKAASYLQDVLLDPILGPSYDPNDAALNAAFKTKLSSWEWFESPGNEHRQLRFGIAMEGSKQAASLNAIREGAFILYLYSIVLIP